jgi:hypothetical protein
VAITAVEDEAIEEAMSGTMTTIIDGIESGIMNVFMDTIQDQHFLALERLLLNHLRTRSLEMR